MILYLAVIKCVQSSTFQLVGLQKWHPQARCNDGSQAVLYLSKGDPSTLLVYFQGGFQCYSQQSCDDRYKTSPDLMSSKGYPSKKTLQGILSQEQTKNKAFYNASKVYLPYCSSDVFVGNFSKWGYEFNGQAVVRAALKGVREMFGQPARLFVGGGSAGARAAAFNIAGFAQEFPGSIVKGMFDSPLWLDILPRYDTWPGTLGIAQFMLQNSNFSPLPSCQQFYKDTPHNCFITQYQLQFITQQFFIASSVADAFIVPMFVQASRPFDHPSLAMAYSIRTIILTQLQVMSSLKQVGGIFSLSCYEHSESLADKFWGSRSDDGVSFNDALLMWLAGNKPVIMNFCQDFACGKNCMSNAETE